MHTKEETIITKPSQKVLKFVKGIRERKQQLRAELRSLKPEEFDMRVYIK